jgi:RimJ/RimL family protein N-acetyltransferase
VTVLEVPELHGTRVLIHPATDADREELEELAWARALHPAMGGWSPADHPGPGTGVVRPIGEPYAVGAVEVRPLAGYPDVANLSVYVDAQRASGGVALEAYGLVVDALLGGGARLVHQEVLELNRPVRRILRAIGLDATAVFREHAYVAGRFWDVHVFSLDTSMWDRVLARLPNNPIRRRDNAQTS